MIGNGWILRMYDALWVGSPTGKYLVSWCTNLGDCKEMRRSNSNVYCNTRDWLKD